MSPKGSQQLCLGPQRGAQQPARSLKETATLPFLVTHFL